MTNVVHVLGGGPAGSAAAISAIVHSAPVSIIEKSRFPRHKVCGEFLSPEIRVVLEQIHCLDGFLALGPASIRRMVLHFGDREKRCALPDAAFGLSRSALDQFLIERALALGAVRLQQAWTSEPTGKIEPAQVIATGRKALAPAGNRLFGFKAHFRGPVDDAVELFFFDHCYVGVSSVEQGTTNVCGLAPERILRACGFRPDELILRSRPLGLRLGPLTRAMGWLTAAPLVFSRAPSVCQAEGSYRAGDALGFTDPFTGSGVLNALLTGFMAGRAAARGLPIPLYLRECRRVLGSACQISSLFRTVLESGWADVLAAAIPGRWLFQWTRPAWKLAFA